MWKYIKVLKGERVKDRRSLKLYGEDGVELERGKAEEEAEEYWSKIYRKHVNGINTIWNPEKKDKYKEEYGKVQKSIEEQRAIQIVREEGVEEEEVEYLETCGIEMREHMEMARRVKAGFMFLEKEQVNEVRVRRCLNKMKNRKAAGTDGIKPEFIKVFVKSEVLMRTLQESMRTVLETGNVPKS